MRIKQRKTRNLNDGYIGVYEAKEKRTDFSAAVSPKSRDDLAYITDLAYKEEYKREQDYTMAEADGHALSLKIKTLLYDELTKDHKIICGREMYNILKIDYARSEGVMYLYLEEERTVAE
ncbi:MAG: hypothetical protein HFJ06_03175 [Lachnospiraceae bacterium]|nr:hypothetical protein [Lachnospiraceae bacterium]